MLLRHWLDLLPVKLSWISRFGRLPGRHIRRLRRPAPFHVAADVLEARQLLSATAVDDHFVAEYNHLYNGIDLFVVDNDLSAAGATLELVGGATSTELTGAWGTLEVIDPGTSSPYIQFTPGSTYVSSFDFDYTVNDGSGASTGSVTVDVLSRQNGDAPVLDDEFTAIRVDDLFGTEGSDYEFLQNTDGLQLLNQRPLLAVAGSESGSIVGRNDDVIGDTRIVIDPTKSYTYSGWFRAGDDDPATSGTYNSNNRHYLGLNEYDFDGNEIHAFNVFQMAGSQKAVLKYDFDPVNDTVIVLEGTGLGWYDGSTANARNLGILNYQTSDGTVHEDYTRYVTWLKSTGLWGENAIVEDFVANETRITLNAGVDVMAAFQIYSQFQDTPPLTNGKFLAGTEVKNSRSSNANNYSLGANLNLDRDPGLASDDGWVYRVATIAGTLQPTSLTTYQFRPGTYSVSVRLRANSTASASAPDVLEYKDLRFGETDSLLVDPGDFSIQDNAIAQFAFDGNTSLSSLGPADFLADELIRIDPARPYALTLSLQSGNDTGGEFVAANAHYVGIAQYDQTGQFLGYAGKTITYTTQDWQQYTLLFSGVSETPNAQSNQLHPDAFFLRPVIEANSNGQASNRLQWRDVRITYAPNLLEGQTQALTFAGQTTYTSNSTHNYLYSDEYIAVRTDQHYQLSMEVQADDINSNGDAIHYFGFVSYDANFKRIDSFNFLKYAGSTDAQLAEDFDPLTDTEIVLQGTGLGWYNGSTGHMRNLSFLNYLSPDGTAYTDYSRYVTKATNGAWLAGSIVEDSLNNQTRITLTSDFLTYFEELPAGSLFAAGTTVRNARSGGTYNYALLANSTIPDDWTTYEATIGNGVMNGTTFDHSKFRPGTAFIKFIGLINWNDNADQTSVTSTQINLRNASITRVNHTNGTLTLNLDVLRNDAAASDPQSVTITGITQPEFGTASIDSGNGTTTHDTITYITDGWFSGTEILEYTFEEADGTEHIGTVRVNVLGHDVEVDQTSGSDWETLKSQTDPANNSIAPSGSDETYTVSYRDTLDADGVNLSGVLANDTIGDSDFVISRLTSGTQFGSLRLSADGTFEYIPLAGFLGVDYFTYEIFDGLHTSSSTVTIHVVDRVPIVDDQTFSVSENAQVNDVLGTIAVENDPGEELTYAILSGNENSIFGLDSNTGIVTVLDSASLDYETATSYSLAIEVTDPSGQSDTAILTITVDDENEAPVFEEIPDTLTLVDQVSNGTIIGRITASDPDATQSAISYSITGGTGQSAFTIDAATGEIQVSDNSSFDATTTPSLTLEVTATEAGSPGLSSSTTLTIQFSEVLPLVQDDYQVLQAGTWTTIDLLANDLGWDGVEFSISELAGELTPEVPVTLTYGTVVLQPKVSETLLNEFVIAGGFANYESLRAYVNERFGDDDLNSIDWFDESLDWTGVEDPLAEVEFDQQDNGFDYYYRQVGNPEDRGQYVLYYVSHDPNTTGQETFEYSVTDAVGRTAAATVTIEIVDGTPVTNAPPVPVADAYTVASDQVLEVAFADYGLLKNDVDRDGDSLQVTLVSGPLNGQLTLQSDGTFSYTPDAGFSGFDSFQYTVNDGTNPESAPQTVQLLVSQGLLTPDALAIDVKVGATAWIDPLADLELEFDTPGFLQLIDVSGGISGTAVVTYAVPISLQTQYESSGGAQRHGSLETFISTHYGSLEAYIRSYGSSDDALALGISYTNSTLAAGQTEDLTYVLRDAQGHLLFGTLTVTGVATSNSAPVAGDDDLIMDRDGFLRFDPRDLDTDADGDELVYTILDEPQHGTLTEQIDGSLIYRPDLGHEGIETLTYEVSDGVLSDTGTITITVRHGITTNNAPALEDQAVNLSEDATLGTTVVVGNLASDADLDTLTYRIASGNSAGLFAIDSASGEITLASTDGLDWETTDSYTLMVEVTDDGFPNVSTSAEYLITILDANDAPIVNSETFILSEDAVNGTSVGTVSGTDADAGQSLTYSIMAGNTNNTFAIDATTGEITLTDATQLQYGTNYSLTVQATDDDVVSPLSGTGTISILIAGVGGNANSAPVLNDDTFTLAEDAAGGTLITTLSASDADAGDSLSYRIVSGNEYGDFQLDSATGALTVTPDAPLDFETISTYTLIIEVRDNGLPALTDTATITITLDDVNEAPTILTETLSMLDDLEQNDAVGKILATDVDAGATLTYAIVTDSSGGLFAIDANTGEVTVASATPGFDAETTPEYTLEIQVSDGTNATTETVMIEVVEQTKAAAQKTLEELLGYAAFAEDVFEAPVTLPGLGLIPEFESAQMGEYLPEFISEWTLAETYPGTTSVGLTTTSLDETIATELVTLTIGTLSIDQVIDGDRTAVGSYTDADNWSYTETVDRLITWDLSYDSNGLSLVATRTRSDQFNWTIEMIAGVFSYTLERIRSSEAMREDTFVYDLSGQTSTTDEDGWVTTVTVGNSTDTALPDTYHATGTQSYTLEATGSRDETGSTPVVTDSYDLEMSVSGDYEYVTTISTHSPLEGGTEPSSLIVSTDSASGQAEWSFVGSRTETGDGTDLTSFDESYTYTGSGDDTYELESSGMFDELETSLETVSRVIDEETEETEEVDYDVTTHLLGTTFFSDSGTAHFEFELAAEQHLDAQGLESESVEVEFLGNGTSAFEIDDQTTTSITSIDVVTGDITEMTLTDLIRETGSLNYFVGSANGIDAATGSSELTTLGESSGSASSYYAESGNSTFEYDLSTDIKVYEDVVRDGNGAILSSHLVLTSQDRLRTATPDNQADSYILTDLRTATRDDEVDTGTFDTYFDASGHTETLTYFYEQFTPQELNEIDENGDPLSTTTATETVYDYSSGTDSWSSISTSGGDFEINADTGYSRITTESTYDDQSSGSYDYATGFESDITNSTFTHYLPEGADPG
ncbi:MAG: hypothetical protein CMN21_08645, partial [Rubinisphaera sp.]|uniref:cadherin domain-containing protein n=1 Tax=Rubinisphaera sp. TaxID=2024857 RepID=UPI000C103272